MPVWKESSASENQAPSIGIRIVCLNWICLLAFLGLLLLPFIRRMEGQGTVPVSPAPRQPNSKSGQTQLPKQLGDHYLMLINTAIASQMNPEKFAQFEKSPYDGLAVAFLHAYDVSRVPTVAEMDARINEWKKTTTKDIWPWVYINRMLAVDPADKNPYSKDAYFRAFSGLDFEDRAGAQKDFLQYWQNALAVAKDTRAPGIVYDPEFYNYQSAYDVGLLAQQTKKKPEEVVVLLQQLGARMADSATAQYPGAVLWFMFTGFGYPEFKVIDGRPYYPSPAYIAFGLLDEIQNRHLPLKVISGGEGSLAYCHETLQQFQDVISKRDLKFAPLVQKYQGILELGGTMTLWSDRAHKQGWVKEGACDTSAAATVEDLQPYLELLLRSFRYNWIYGSGDGGYMAFVPLNADRFDAVITKAKSRAYSTISH